eukprot:14253411-Alexandrium_andersonii.AAC.1
MRHHPALSVHPECGRRAVRRHTAPGCPAAAGAAHEVNLVEELQRPRAPAGSRSCRGQGGPPVCGFFNNVGHHHPRSQPGGAE